MNNAASKKGGVPRFLVIQTAFIGDVILATALIKTLHLAYPTAKIEVLVRKGNESLLQADPHISRIWVWNKENRKLFNLVCLGLKLFRVRYSGVIVLQRYFSGGWLGLMARGKVRVCFKQNPLSWFYTHSYSHALSGIHEVQRNQALLTAFVPAEYTRANNIEERPHLEHSTDTVEKIRQITAAGGVCYVIAPASVWPTKQVPKTIWEKIIKKLPNEAAVYLVGGKADRALCEELASFHPRGSSLAGSISLIETYLLMKCSRQVFVNDSAPLHLASAANVATVAFFCSTVPAFGFGPLAEVHQIIECTQLDCRPCGIHGHKVCPQGHFRCGKELPIEKIQFL